MGRTGPAGRAGRHGLVCRRTGAAKRPPTGQNGQWAIVGATDTIWIWDSDTSAWVDSGANMDLSQYYTKTEADARFLGAGDETVVRFVEISSTKRPAR